LNGGKYASAILPAREIARNFSKGSEGTFATAEKIAETSGSLVMMFIDACTVLSFALPSKLERYRARYISKIGRHTRPGRRVFYLGRAYHI
jgi:hypothetical protein